MTNEYKPGDFFVAEDGTRYRAEADYNGCDGCAGDGKSITPICAALPTGCSEDRVIWIKEESA
jgi:hypothetical protein